jgi:hypothetical protein
VSVGQSALPRFEQMEQLQETAPVISPSTSMVTFPQ